MAVAVAKGRWQKEEARKGWERVPLVRARRRGRRDGAAERVRGEAEEKNGGSQGGSWGSGQWGARRRTATTS